MSRRQAHERSQTDFLKRHRVPFDGRFSIDDVSCDPPDGTPSKKELDAEHDELVERLDELQQRLFADRRHALLTVFQALDAAGKDSTIRKVFSGVNPAGFRVHAFGRPSELELRHDFLQRVAERLPERGKIGIFNRSHYEEVLVVRVHPEFLAAQNLPSVGPEAHLGRALRVDPEFRAPPRRERHDRREILAQRLAQGTEEALPRAHREAGQELEVPARRPGRPRALGRFPEGLRVGARARPRANGRPGTRFPPTTRLMRASRSRASWSRRSSA